MIGSATPCAAEPDARSLREMNARSQFEAMSPGSIPGVRWDAIHRSVPKIEPKPSRRVAMTLPCSLAARLRTLAPDNEELGHFLEDLALAVRSTTGSGYDLSDPEAFAAGLPLEPKPAPQLQMQALVHDFRRRQNQASLLVAGCVAASFVLTVIGVAALATFTRGAPAGAEPAAKTASSVFWHEPQDAQEPKLILAKASPFNEPAPNAAIEPTVLREPATAPAAATSLTPQLIVVHPGRNLEFAALLSQRQARYVLIRGLPSDITPSAGQRNPSGAWLVKDKDLDRLSLSIGSTANGDYPVEVYALGAASAPQARQRFMFRVEASAGPTTASAPDQPTAVAQPSPLMQRAMRLLGEGDIAGARLLLMHLAEQGESDAAYQLARTFDAEYLTEIGAQGVGPDKTRAVGWYERASETGNAKAAERLKILASLSG